MLIGSKEIGLELDRIAIFQLSMLGYDSISNSVRFLALSDSNPNHPFVYKPGIWALKHNGISFNYGKFSLNTGENVLNVINGPIEELKLVNPNATMELWVKLYRTYQPGDIEARIRSFP